MASMPDGPDIVIVARKNPASSIGFDQVASPTPVTANYGGGGGGGGAEAQVASVNVLVDNQANLQQAIQAAQNVASTLIVIQEKMEALPADTPIRWGVYTLTAAEVLAILRNTQFIVTDRTYTNGGVGEAIASEGGQPGRNFLDFRFFVGPTSYASPNYTDNQGMNGIMLHEIAHLSQQGLSFRRASEGAYSRLNDGSYDGYVYSSHWVNNEKFANDFLRAAAAAANINISTFNPKYNYGHISPSQVR